MWKICIAAIIAGTMVFAGVFIFQFTETTITNGELLERNTELLDRNYEALLRIERKIYNLPRRVEYLEEWRQAEYSNRLDRIIEHVENNLQ